MRKKIVAIMLAVLLLATATALLCACNDEPTEYGAYVMTDKATYLRYKNNADGDLIPNLTILYEADEDLKNTYSMIAVDPNGAGFASKPTLNTIGADCFIKWMSLVSTRSIIANYGKEEYDATLFYLLENAQTFTGLVSEITYAASGATDNVISISTTTSVNDSGLLVGLETLFETQTGFDLQVSSKGTGAAIEDAKNGNADLLLVHAKSSEEAFINENFARTVTGLTGLSIDENYPERIPFMYNYFVLVGSKKDPAKVKEADTVKEAFASIAAGKYNFISRGDASGTHKAEIKLWDSSLKIVADVSALPTNLTWYISAAQGMGACLTMANTTAIKG